ncbi:unnamed protein product [Ascophyllum nodosum]
MSQSLYFARNDMYLPWCLERLAKTSTTKNAKSLAILQGPAVYYTALGVKRDTDMTAVRKKEAAAHSLKHFASSAWLSWLKDEYEFALPAWFTMDLFGQTTISGTGQKLYEPTGESLWNRYKESGREIRASFQPIVDA